VWTVVAPHNSSEERSRKKFEEKLNQQSWMSSITNRVLTSLHFSSFPWLSLSWLAAFVTLNDETLASLIKQKHPAKEESKKRERERGLKSEQEAQKLKVGQCQVLVCSKFSSRFTSSIQVACTKVCWMWYTLYRGPNNGVLVDHYYDYVNNQLRTPDLPSHGTHCQLEPLEVSPTC
jgi:hypothetical protein